MRAAVVTSFDRPPTCQDFPTPTPQTPDEVLVDVIASGLHPRVRSQADGSHYTSTDELPLVPGFDGVGRAPDGSLRYFILPDTSMGAMAEQTVVNLRRSVILAEDCDPDGWPLSPRSVRTPSSPSTASPPTSPNTSAKPPATSTSSSTTSGASPPPTPCSPSSRSAANQDGP
jgi:hypothetical protein